MDRTMAVVCLGIAVFALVEGTAALLMLQHIDWAKVMIH